MSQILGRSLVRLRECVDVLEDEGADAFKCTEVREDLEVDIRMCSLRFFYDTRDVVGHMNPSAEQVGEYLDFHGSLFGQSGNG